MIAQKSNGIGAQLDKKHIISEALQKYNAMNKVSTDIKCFQSTSVCIIKSKLICQQQIHRKFASDRHL